MYHIYRIICHFRCVILIYLMYWLISKLVSTIKFIKLKLLSRSMRKMGPKSHCGLVIEIYWNMVAFCNVIINDNTIKIIFELLAFWCHMICYCRVGILKNIWILIWLPASIFWPNFGFPHVPFKILDFITAWSDFSEQRNLLKWYMITQETLISNFS